MSTATSAAIAVSTHNTSTQRDASHALTAKQSQRIRDAARKLGVSEAELLATGVSEHVTAWPATCATW